MLSLPRRRLWRRAGGGALAPLGRRRPRRSRHRPPSRPRGRGWDVLSRRRNVWVCMYGRGWRSRVVMRRGIVRCIGRGDERFRTQEMVRRGWSRCHCHFRLTGHKGDELYEECLDIGWCHLLVYYVTTKRLQHFRRVDVDVCWFIL